MGPFAELIAIDHRQTLEFFAVRLQDISEPDVDREELLYNASVLAHYAQTSTCAATDLGTPASLSEVFDHFVFDSTLRRLCGCDGAGPLSISALRRSAL